MTATEIAHCMNCNPQIHTDISKLMNKQWENFSLQWNDN